LILDGAKQPISLSEHELATRNVTYIHSGTRFNERLASAGQLVTTPYAALLCDDEFFLKDGLRESVSFLEDNPSVIGCTGKVLGFFVDQNRFLTFPMYEDWKSFPLGINDARNRLDFALPPNKAHKVQFSLFRSEIWARLFHESYKDFYSSGYIYERILNLYSAILGRTELLECVVWMRSLENPPLSTENVPRVDGRDFVSWATNPQFSHEVEHLRSCARRLLESAGDLTRAEVEDFLHRFIEGGIERQHTKETRKSGRYSRRVGSLLIKYSPRVFKQLAKRWLPSRALKITGWNGNSLERTLEGLEVSGVRACRESLNQISQLACRTKAQVSNGGCN
jgi:glycosyltransferase domain-containing protein